MRIVSVYSRVGDPPHRGAAVRCYHLLRELSLRHEVRQFTQAPWRGLRDWNTVVERPLAPSFVELRHYHPLAALATAISCRAWHVSPVWGGLGLSMARPTALRRLLEWADVILVEHPWHFRYCRSLHPKAPLIYSSVNVEIFKFESMARSLRTAGPSLMWLRQVEALEREAVHESAMIVAVSNADRQGFVDRYGADAAKIVVVPNGADVQRHRPTDASERRIAKQQLGLPDRPLALFMGSAMPPNIAGMECLKRIARRTDRFTFVVVGLVSHPQVDGNLICTGAIPDVTPYERAADFAVCPISAGGGTKIKLLQSMAAGLPTVSFHHTVEGTTFVHNEHLVACDENDDAMLAALIELSENPERAGRIGRAARSIVASGYDWRTIALTLETALRSLTKGS